MEGDCCDRPQRTSGQHPEWHPERCFRDPDEFAWARALDRGRAIRHYRRLLVAIESDAWDRRRPRERCVPGT